ncbi:MAG: hypothetical protein ABI602_03750 [Candidatus Saccharibacteria bacterium]
MDDVLLRKVSRQLKLLNFVVTAFGLLILASFAVTAVLLFKAITYVHTEATKLDSLQKQATQALDVKQQLCSDKTISAFVKSQSGFCN